MHVAVDLNWFLQFVVLALAAAFGFLYLVRNTASRYFVVDSNFVSAAADFSSDRNNGRVSMAPAVGEEKVSDACAVCGLTTKKKCARCKMVNYCSETCQRTHWNSEHKTKCKNLKLFNQANHAQLTSVLKERTVSLVPASGSSKIFKKSNKILFPYEEFVRFFNWDKPDYPPPCGLLNCGNSCFANVVLQCLAYTRPLVAYLLEKGHKTECQMDSRCFFCEFQNHIERATRSVAPFSPINILSHLPNIGGNLGYGQQEDAHEFMRFAIDKMQSVCLNEFGGEKAVHPSYQQTTLIQHIFGGRLQSQVICTECNNVSNQFENMMDLTVEIHGDAETLEECLDQFTAKEQLHGDNMYKCDGCNAYVTAWKRLSVQQAPNILTIALKRFQSGRFGKLNKRVTFPEKLNLRPYMSELEDGNEYVLYAVIVHLDMLNASFFGHYICYVKDFRGNWYRADDCEVARVDLDAVLSQGAYMLLYKRIHARSSCLLRVEFLKKEENDVKTQAVDPSMNQPIECLSAAGHVDSEHLPSANCSGASFNIKELSVTNLDDARSKVKIVSTEASSPVENDEKLPDFGVAPKVVGSVDDTVKPVHMTTSFIDNSPMELDANNVMPSVSDIKIAKEGNRSNATEGLQGILVDELTTAENCKTEEGKASDVSPITTSETREVGSSSSTSTLDNTECRNGARSPDNDTKKTAKNSNGESSGAKLKPVFAPGFLGKHRQKDPKRKDNVPVEVKETPKNRLNEQINEVVKDEEEHCSVLKNGKVPTESTTKKSLRNGDSEPSNCIHCKFQNPHNKRNAAGGRAAKPCC